MKDQNIEKLWQDLVSELRLTISPTVFQTFFAQTRLESLQENVATLACANPYLQDLVEKRYYSLLKSILDRLTSQNISLVFTLYTPEEKTTPSSPAPLFDLKPSSSSPSSTSPSSPSFPFENGHSSASGLHPRYSFQTFVVGNSNNFAHAAARAIVENPGLTYNPLFIWGGVGIGKTHLMQAIGHALLEKNPKLKVLYINAETFTNDLVNSLRRQTTSSFKEKYRQLDLLLVDDIQFIAGKEFSQEEFFHTFNALHMKGNQIILTSDQHPSRIQRLEDRLVSRFSGGLTVDIQSPDLEMRVAIIKQKSREKSLELSEEAIMFLAETLKSNTREIEGRLQELSIQALSQKITQLDLIQTQKFLGFKTAKTEGKKVHYRRILSTTSSHFKIKTSELIGKSRRKNYTLARHIAAYLLRRELELPLTRVGEILGGRDHTSIMHAESKIDKAFTNNQEIRHHIMQIRQQL